MSSYMFYGRPSLDRIKWFLILIVFFGLILFRTTVYRNLLADEPGGITPTNLPGQILLPMISGGPPATENNRPPVANNNHYTLKENIPLMVSGRNGVLANDSDPDDNPLHALLVTPASHGTLNLRQNGSFTYTPDPDFAGRDSFTYRASDGKLVSAPATVSLDIESRIYPPQILTGEVAFTREIIGTGVLETHAAAAADLDRDGDMDIVATDYVNSRVIWYENNGQFEYTERILDADLAGAYPIWVGDVDLDGYMDVLTGGYLGDLFIWYRNDGGGEFTRFVIDTIDGPHSIIPGDLDDDGDIDLIATAQDANTVVWYVNDGNEIFTRYLIDDAAIQAKMADFVDFDNDGDIDLVAASFRNEVVWYENDGSQTFTKRIIDPDARGAYWVATADLDGDGDIDVLSANQRENRVTWYRNDGADGFSKETIAKEVKRPRTVIAVDIDNDGDMDAVSASVDDDTIAWHVNDGRGNFTMRVIDNEEDGAYGVWAVDIDFDGDSDLLTAARDSNQITLRRQLRIHTATVAINTTLAIDPSLLRTVHRESGPAALTYTMTEAPAYGELRVNNAAVLSGGTFTQADIDNGLVRYVHAGNNRLTDQFRFTVADSRSGRSADAQPPSGSLIITITD